MPNSKKILTITITITIIISLVLLVIVSFLNKSAQKDIEEMAMNEHSEHLQIITREVTKTLGVEIDNVQEKLNIIAQIPEIRSGDTKTCSRKLKEIYENMHVKLGNIGRVNEDGIFYCGVVDSIVGVDGKKYPYIRKIISDPAHKPVLSRAIMFEYTDHVEYLVALHVPVFDEVGTFIGTLGGAIYFDEIQDKYFKDVASLDGGDVFLQDDNGDVLYNPNSDFLGRNVNDEYMQNIWAESQELQDLIKNAQAGLIGTKKYIYRGKWKIAAYESVHIFEDRYWPLIVTISHAGAEGFAASIISKLQYQVFIVIGALILLALGMIIFMVRWNQTLQQRVKERTRQLEEAKNRSEVLLASIGDGVFAIDKERNIIHFNKRAEELSGYKAAEVLGKPYYDVLKFVKEKDRSENVAFIRKAFKGETTDMADETFLIGKDQSELSVADSAAPIKDEKGEVLGVIVVFRDASQERKIQQMRSEFMSLASHELKTPLTVIKGYLEELKDETAGKLTKEQQRLIGIAMKASNALLRLTYDLLEVSRLEEGRLKTELIVVNPIDLAEKAITTELRQTFKQKKQKFTFMKPETLPKIKVDPKFIMVPIQNLLSNASKYTPEKGKIELEVSQKKNRILFRITDSGVGIPRVEQLKVFQRFFRASNTTNLERGTGLGLYMTKLMIETSGGRIWFESEEKKGSTFYFSLPVFG